MADITLVNQCAPHEPCQQRPAEQPEKQEQCIDGKIQARSESSKAV